MKKLLIGCMAAIAALLALSGCDQDKVLYNGSSYLIYYFHWVGFANPERPIRAAV